MRYSYAPGSDAAHDAAVRAEDTPPAPPAASTVRVLTSARPYDPATPSTPTAVKGLAALAPAARVTFALAEDTADGRLIASLAVRIPGVGYAVYARTQRPGRGVGGWESNGCVVGRNNHLLNQIVRRPPSDRCRRATVSILEDGR